MSSVRSSNHSKSCSSQKFVAENRWKILAGSLTTLSSDHQVKTHEQDSSNEDFHTFNLIKYIPLKNKACSSLTDLFQCTATIQKETYFVNIQIPRRRFTLPQIAGFNNTGNVRVWPTEEVMAYYALSNLEIFHGKRVLELGGGMTCLAGLIVAKYSSAARTCLTDGNASCIENVATVLDMNCLDQPRVSCHVLDWADTPTNHAGTYDVILSADCLFFDDTRDDLVETTWTLLADNGLAIVMAPRRGDTLHEFTALAKARGFRCVTRQNYNDLVWSQHLLLKEMPKYSENNHYPILLELSKKTPKITKQK